MFDAINGINGFQDIFDGIVQRVFAGFECQTLVSHVLQGDNFFPNLLLCQLLAGYCLVLQVIRTIYATIDTIIGKI